MSRYIRIDEAKERTTQLFHGYEVKQWLETLPSIDICFCRECKYRERCEQIVVFDIGENQVEGRKIDFCSYGERNSEIPNNYERQTERSE